MTIEFKLAAARAIFGQGSGFIVSDGTDGRPAGVWLETCEPDPDLGVVENEVLLWHPLGAIYEPGGPDPQETPSLPIPFTSRQLAACFLSGRGFAVAGWFGDWKDGPDEDALKKFLQGSPAAQAAVRAAFGAYREALSVVDKGPLDAARERAAELHRAARNVEDDLPDALTSVGINQAYAAHANALAAADLKERQWLGGMVRHLLHGNATPQQEAEKTPINKTGKTTKPKWRDQVWPYLIKELQAAAFASAKEFFNHIESKTKDQDSPFSKGANDHRGKLIVKAISQQVSLKTFQNDWGKLKAAAASSAQ